MANRKGTKRSTKDYLEN